MIRGKTGYGERKEWTYDEVISLDGQEFRAGDLVEVKRLRLVTILPEGAQVTSSDIYTGVIKRIEPRRGNIQGFHIHLDISEKYNSEVVTISSHDLEEIKKIEKK